MNHIYEITMIGLLAGIIGTGSGGLIALILKKPKKELLSFFLGFAGGIMLAIVFADLLPEAVEFGGILPAMAGLIVGTLLILALDLYLPHTHFFQGTDEYACYVRTGAMLGLGIAMHNLPEGIAIGAGYMASPALGLGLAITIAIHNVPEGMAMAAPMCAGGVSVKRVFLYTGMAGVPMGIGAFIGATVSNISPIVLSLALGFAGGAMLYIVFDELIPDAQKLAKGHSGTFGAVFGAIFGTILLYFLH